MALSKLEDALQIIQSPQNTLSPWKVAKATGVSYRSLQRRLMGNQTAAERNSNAQLLMPVQESVLEAYIIYLAQNQNIPTGRRVRELALKILQVADPSAPLPSSTWLSAFIHRSRFLERKRHGKLDFPRVRESGERLIGLFFELLAYYEETFHVTLNNVWNLDEAGFKCGESRAGGFGVVPLGAAHTVSHDSSELVTVLEAISATGKIGMPLFIYKGVHLMEAWFLTQKKDEVTVSTSKTAFIDGDIFYEWFHDYFPAASDNHWSILFLDGHSSHTSEKFLQEALKRKVIPLFYPSHMTNILQPLDRSCFGVAKQYFRAENTRAFAEGFEPSKRSFFETYLSIRSRAFSEYVIKDGWKRAGIYPRNKHLSIWEFRRQMNLPLDGSSPAAVPVVENHLRGEQDIDEDITDPVVANPTWRAAWASLLSRNTQIAIATCKRYYDQSKDAEARLAILDTQLQSTQNQLAELQQKQSKKRTRIPRNNKKVLHFLPEVQNDERHPLAALSEEAGDYE